MNLLILLPKARVSDCLTEWLTLKDLVKIDGAMCNSISRKYLLEELFGHIVVNNSVTTECGYNCNHGIRYLPWCRLRKVKLRTFPFMLNHEKEELPTGTVEFLRTDFSRTSEILISSIKEQFEMLPKLILPIFKVCGFTALNTLTFCNLINIDYWLNCCIMLSIKPSKRKIIQGIQTLRFIKCTVDEQTYGDIFDVTYFTRLTSLKYDVLPTSNECNIIALIEANKNSLTD